MRKHALDAFVEARIRHGYRVETRTDTHAIIAPPPPGRSFLDRFRPRPPSLREVVAVDEGGRVTTSSAEPIRF